MLNGVSAKWGQHRTAFLKRKNAKLLALLAYQEIEALKKLRGKMNARQVKVIARLIREGPEGFKGGLSAEKYISIARTSRATATRDLQELVEIGALQKTGERKYTRYQLCIT